MIPLSQSLLLASFKRENAGLALTIWSMTSLVAPVVGPVLGGWITDNIHWAWIFYINIPVGLLAAGVAWWIYREREAPTMRRPIDLVGLAVMVLWIGCFQIVLDKGKELDWFESWTIIWLLIIAAAGFCFFLLWELTEDHPIVDLSLFKRRNFWASTLTISLGYGAFFGNLVLLPLWLQQYMGYTPTLAGLAMAPVGLLALVISPWVGKNIQRYDARLFATFGFLVFALVVLMRSHFNTNADFNTILWPTILQGAAIGTFFIPLFNLALQGIPPERIPNASGLLNFCRITAGAFGASLCTTVWDDRAAFHHARLVEHLDPTNPMVLGFAAGDGASLAQLNRLIDQQAFMLAANEIFQGCAVLFLALVGIVWLARPERVVVPAAAGDAGGAH